MRRWSGPTTNTDLAGADVGRADFTKANLTGASLAAVTDANLVNAVGRRQPHRPELSSRKFEGISWSTPT